MDKMNERKHLIWGAGRNGRYYIEKINKNIEKVIDSNQKRTGETFLGIPVCSPDEIKDFKNCFIHITMNNYKDVESFLQRKGLKLHEDYEPFCLFGQGSFEMITKEHFQKLEYDDAVKLFAASVKLVEIEVFSYCNRQCWFCPNKVIDRYTTNNYMDENVYLSVLDDLRKVNYQGVITYSRYNEPLSDRIILERIKQAADRLPNATLHTNTNGDYLTNEFIEDLYQSGLRSINIQVYLNEKEQFNYQYIMKMFEKRIQKINLPFVLTKTSLDWIEGFFKYKDMSIRMYARDFRENGCNRAESVDICNDYIRLSPCIIPFTNLYIDYNGSVVPCCNIRSDNPKHVEYVLGNVKDASVIDIFSNEEIIKWRQSLLNFGSEKRHPCKSCSYALMDSEKDNFEEFLREADFL